MNSKSSFVVLIIGSVLLFALLTRNGSVLVLALPFIVYLIIGLLGSPVELSIQVQRSTDKAEAVAGEPVKTQIVVENHGKALANLHLADAVPGGVNILEGQAKQTLALAAGENTTVEYVGTATRGLYTWHEIHATASDPFRLFEARRTIPAFAEVRVRPAPLKLEGVPIRPKETLHAPGPTAARLAGAGTDFWSVREYRVGDPLRRLNWRLAGRYPKRLFTNEYEGEEIADLGFIVDARRLTRAHEMENALFESSVAAATSLSEMFLNKGDRVALLIFGETTTSLFPGSGKKQLSLVTRHLARAKQGPNLSFRYLEYFPARLFPRRSILLAFSALDARDVETYARLRAFGYDILLISPNPVDYMGRKLPANEVNALAYRAARLERILLLKRLVKMGVGVIDWHVSQPLDIVLQRTARYMAYRRRT
jgi:uncharacterized protein (DUF58 family)